MALDFAKTHILQDFFAPTKRITQQDQALWCLTGKVGLGPDTPDGSVLSIHSTTILTPMRKENSLTTNHSGQFCPGFPLVSNIMVMDNLTSQNFEYQK